MEEEIIKLSNDNKGELRTKKIVSYIKYIPVIYPILIFLGYLNFDLFYKRFDINIFNYLNINEFLFSFVSLVYPFMFMIIFSTALSVFTDLMKHIYGDIEKDKKNEVDKKHFPIILKKTFFKNKFVKANRFFINGKYVHSIKNFVLGILFFIMYIFSALYPAFILFVGFYLVVNPLLMAIQELNVENLGYFDTALKIIYYPIIWFFIFGFYILILFGNKKISFKSFRIYLIGTLCCILISSLIRYQNLRSHNFLYEKAEKSINFIYENKIVKSSEKNKLLGITSEYIFLRDIESKTNYIYKIDNVKNLEITSLKK